MTTTTYTNKQTNESVEVEQIDPWTVATLDEDGEHVEVGRKSTIISMINKAGYFNEAEENYKASYRNFVATTGCLD